MGLLIGAYGISANYPKNADKSHLGMSDILLKAAKLESFLHYSPSTLCLLQGHGILGQNFVQEVLGVIREGVAGISVEGPMTPYLHPPVRER